jgi:hypothetical protein
VDSTVGTVLTPGEYVRHGRRARRLDFLATINEDAWTAGDGDSFEVACAADSERELRGDCATVYEEFGLAD